MIKLSLGFDEKIQPFGQAEVQRVIDQIPKAITKVVDKDIVIGVRVADQSVLRQLNLKYGGEDHATDVLSFNYDEDSKKQKAKSKEESDLRNQKEGDIVISHQHVRFQAQQAQTDLETELALLVLHGILHILGYDHQNEEEKNRIDGLQLQIMTAAGLTYRNFGWTH